MAFFDLQPIGDGVRITLTSHDERSSVSTVRDRREAERLVRNICRVAGLPEPWKKG